jgi:hypothetical protein
LASRSRPLALRVAELEAAIANVTRVLGTAPAEAVVALVNERAAMREELRALAALKQTNVVALNRRR